MMMKSVFAVACVFLAAQAISGGSEGMGESPASGASSGTGGAEARYAVAMVALGERRWNAVRYDARSGRAWQMRRGAWVRIAEFPGRRPGVGDFQVVAVRSGDGRMSAVRYEVRSGNSWHLDEDRWLPIADEPAATRNSKRRSRHRGRVPAEADESGEAE